MNDIMRLLTRDGLWEAAKEAMKTGDVGLHSYHTEPKPVRRMSLEMNDDGSAFIVFHKTHYQATPSPSAKEKQRGSK